MGIKKMNKLLLISSFLAISINAFSNEKTDKAFMANLKLEGINPEEQSYCYTDEKNNLQGINVDKKIRLASTSKLITALWAVEKLGVDYVFPLKLYIKGKNLHLEGSYDPFLNNEKIYFLLSQLNDLGFESFETITFDKLIYINPEAQYYAGEHPYINATSNIANIKKYFNTLSWSKELKDEYSNYYNLAKSGKYRKEVKMQVANIKYSESNPFLNEVGVKTLTLNSPPLYKYLKEMNVKSNNYVAETLFRKLGNVSKFNAFASEKFGLNNEKIKLWTGSGLPYVDEDNTRFDNFASCSIILDFIQELKNSAERQGRELQDIVAVPGNDKGTFKNRLFPDDYKNSFVAKTGTLMHTSALAGAMNTQKGYSFFGIFNMTSDNAGAHTVQNEMVKSIMKEMGGPKAFDYEVEGFHSYGNDTLKDHESEEFSDFSSIDGGLE